MFCFRDVRTSERKLQLLNNAAGGRLTSIQPWFNPRPSGCIRPHFDAILICFELPPLLPPRWFPSLTSPCWRCSSSLHADDLYLSWTPEPPSATPVEVQYALMIHSYHMSKPTESSFTEYIIHAILSSSDSNLFLCHLWWAAFSLSLVLLLEATPLHCTERLLLRTTSSSPLG